MHRRLVYQYRIVNFTTEQLEYFFGVTDAEHCDHQHLLEVGHREGVPVTMFIDTHVHSDNLLDDLAVAQSLPVVPAATLRLEPHDARCLRERQRAASNNPVLTARLPLKLESHILCRPGRMCFASWGTE